MNGERKAEGVVHCGTDVCCEYMTGAAYSVMEKKAPVLIVFDIDGTLSDTVELGRELFKQVFALMGYGVISDELADSFNGPSADEVCRVMGVGPDRRPLYNELLETIEDELVEKMGRMYPGAAQMLEALAPHAVLALLTNGTQRYCETTIREFSLTPYITLHSGYVSGVSKAQRMLQWARETGARRVICVGDRSTDVNNGKAVGALTIAVTYGLGAREELEGADIICDTTAEVTKACLRAIGEY
ncbi:MAG: HAD family hydrolase [Clostridia bacterium]|nr:HAD family hydrolase [Clostridia bacterium]